MESSRHLARNAFEDEGEFVIRMQNYTGTGETELWVRNGSRLEINDTGFISGSWGVSETDNRIYILSDPKSDDKWGVGSKHIEVR